MAKYQSKGFEAGGVALIGSTILGLAVGLWNSDPVIYTIGGFGVGFLLMAVFRMSDS